jgi:hypothetical protein
VPGSTRPVAGSAAAAIRTCGPSAKLPLAASGSRARLARTTNDASPILIRSPVLSLRRASEFPVALRHSRSERKRWVEGHRAEQRIILADDAQLDERDAAAAPRHRAHFRDPRHGAALPQKRELRFGRGAMHEMELDIAAQQRARIRRQPRRDGGNQRADAGDHHHAQRETGEEDAEAAQAPAQFAECP